MEGESNLARRIAHERARTGLSYEGLAKRMTDVGCSIQGSAIYRIEKGDPPRRVNVDELLALAEVFETSAADLLTPMELIDQQHAARLLERIDVAERGLFTFIGEMVGSYTECLHLAEANPELFEYVTGHLFASLHGAEGADARTDARTWYAVEGVPSYDPSPFVQTTKDFFLATLHEAQRLTLAVLDAQREGAAVSRLGLGKLKEGNDGEHPETS